MIYMIGILLFYASKQPCAKMCCIHSCIQGTTILSCQRTRRYLCRYPKRSTLRSGRVSLLGSERDQDTICFTCRLGSGTGIFTRALLAHESFANSVRHLTAIEPSDGMREVFSKQYSDARVETKAGTFDNTGLASETADFIAVAQAWHWCPNYDAGIKEIARVLKPSGVAIFIWNLEE